MMRVLASFALLFVLTLAGCKGMAVGGDNPKEMAEVKYEYVAVLANFHRVMLIQPDGIVMVEQQTSKDPKDILAAKGTITDPSRQDLLHALHGWKSLQHAYTTDFGTILSISYDGYLVTTTPSAKTPDQVLIVQRILDRIAYETLLAAGKLPPASQPAQASATRPISQEP